MLFLFFYFLHHPTVEMHTKRLKHIALDFAHSTHENGSRNNRNVYMFSSNFDIKSPIICALCHCQKKYVIFSENYVDFFTDRVYTLYIASNKIYFKILFVDEALCYLWPMRHRIKIGSLRYFRLY